MLPEQVRSSVRFMLTKGASTAVSLDEGGFVTFDEFKRAVADEHDDDDGQGVGHGAGGDAGSLHGAAAAQVGGQSWLGALAQDDDFDRIVISQKQIAELGAAGGAAAGGGAGGGGGGGDVEVAVLRKIHFRVVPHTSFKRIWSSNDVNGSLNSASVWAPETEEGWFASKLGRRKEIICLGHYVSAGQQAPHKAAAKTKRGDYPLPKLLEVTDTGSLGITGSKVRKRGVYPVCCCVLCAVCCVLCAVCCVLTQPRLPLLLPLLLPLRDTRLS